MHGQTNKWTIVQGDSYYPFYTSFKGEKWAKEEMYFLRTHLQLRCHHTVPTPFVCTTRLDISSFLWSFIKFQPRLGEKKCLKEMSTNIAPIHIVTGGIITYQLTASDPSGGRSSFLSNSPCASLTADNPSSIVNTRARWAWVSPCSWNDWLCKNKKKFFKY